MGGEQVPGHGAWGPHCRLDLCSKGSGKPRRVLSRGCRDSTPCMSARLWRMIHTVSRCSPQLLAYRSSSPSWLCATPSSPRRMETTSSTRPRPQVRALGCMHTAVPFLGDLGVCTCVWEMGVQPGPQRPCWPLAACLMPHMVYGLRLGSWCWALLTPVTLMAGDARLVFPSAKGQPAGFIHTPPPPLRGLSSCW